MPTIQAMLEALYKRCGSNSAVADLLDTKTNNIKYWREGKNAALFNSINKLIEHSPPTLLAEHGTPDEFPIVGQVANGKMSKGTVEFAPMGIKELASKSTQYAKTKGETFLVHVSDNSIMGINKGSYLICKKLINMREIKGTFNGIAKVDNKLKFGLVHVNDENLAFTPKSVKMEMPTIGNVEPYAVILGVVTFASPWN